jgi:hypothetical protein
MADALTLDFVRALFAAEQPGRQGATDLLAISFSATDYIGHAFGPDSLEAEDNLLRLDRTLAELFDLLEREVGLERTLLVLTSDHGTAPVPEYVSAQGFDAGRHDPERFMQQVNAALRKRFAIDRDLALEFWIPGIYLDHPLIERLGLDTAAVERAVAEEIVRMPGRGGLYAQRPAAAACRPPQPPARRRRFTRPFG